MNIWTNGIDLAYISATFPFGFRNYFVDSLFFSLVHPNSPSTQSPTSKPDKDKVCLS